MKTQKNVLGNVATERKNYLSEFSIFLKLEAGEKTIVAVNGVAVRQQEFKKGISTVVDLRVLTTDEKLRIFSTPSFSPVMNDILELLEKHGVKVKRTSEGRPNLKDFSWTGIEPIIVEISPKDIEGKIYPGKLIEVEQDQKVLSLVEA